jgi:chromosome segregation ATPase
LIQLLIKLGKWLEARFPKKLLVLESDYRELKSRLFSLDGELSILRQDIKEHLNNIELVVSRVGTIEAAAVHKDAVKSVISELQKVKDEFASLKTSLGFNRSVQTPPEITAMLNGEILGDQSNG